jgi:hypothetical protein
MADRDTLTCNHFWSAGWLEDGKAKRRCQYCDLVEVSDE